MWKFAHRMLSGMILAKGVVFLLLYQMQMQMTDAGWRISGVQLLEALGASS